MLPTRRQFARLLIYPVEWRTDPAIAASVEVLRGLWAPAEGKGAQGERGSALSRIGRDRLLIVSASEASYLIISPAEAEEGYPATGYPRSRHTQGLLLRCGVMVASA
jgi:hypothetical protein